MTERRQYEEAVLMGLVFSPAMLLPLPFLDGQGWRVFALAMTALGLSLGGSGAIVFRRLQESQRSMLAWRCITAFIVATGFVALTFGMASVHGGKTFAVLLLLITFLGVVSFAVYSIRTGIRRDKEADFASIGKAGALGATIGGVGISLVGDTASLTIVVVLMVALATVAGYACVDFYRDWRSSM